MEDTKNETQEEEKNQVEEAKKLLQSITEQNQIMGEHLKHQERLKAESIIGGLANAGQPSTSKEQEEIKSARNLLKGTGFEDKLFPEI